MSRVGKKEIPLPKGVTVSVEGNTLRVKGAKGELTQTFRDDVSFNISADKVEVVKVKSGKDSSAMHGLYRALLANMVKGVSDGFVKTLIISGTGYRAEVKGTSVFLNLGYSTQIEYVVPEGVSVVAEMPTKLNVSGIDKAAVGQVAAEIRGIRKPGTYSDKGIRYSDEIVKRKVGKTGVK
ncbi:50S ribosomal protein L6 [Entomospira culicis]|uniref:Large ribosomal subunit protein uL6 n=1 Tax=Entomospira culicis TaxID=2719989 RepID=A0A968GG74_9SPIO|nr:50S ribosomal protein L6 [Entomospira culicis]NIZ19704.1 50S ribosomal protein L6 [Entomospira culicis]NIZ69918.1 50S ribosomal protein L6 [Entomospira culicis]WDI37023.1 50S ribosomal protein L6 [Entomospira culicis]WDI38652.1 50S ribosomal protein L6 [Entomospira culicis]